MKKWKITCISDTHTKHNKLDGFLPGGDILIHSGDLSSRGYLNEIEDFFKWYDKIDNYDHKIFIAGNHDFGFQDQLTEVKEILTNYQNINYIQDDLLVLGEGELEYNDMLKIWGTPWQPEFFNWAFNLPRGEKLKEKWDMIPLNTDILITHGPPFGKLDYVRQNNINVGCEELLKRIEEIKPKINIFGHIHSGRGIVFSEGTLYINASILNDRYEFNNKPITIDFDFDTGEWDVIDF